MDHWRQALPVPVLDVDYEETVADLAILVVPKGFEDGAEEPRRAEAR